MLHTFAYNSRLQPTEIADTVQAQAGCGVTAQTGQSAFLLDLQLYWGDSASQTLNNNGNLRGQLINTCKALVANNYWEVFGYDNVNRLTSATDNGGSGWIRNYSYDAFGNMWTPNPTGGPLSGYTPQQNVYNASKNQVSGWSYDAAGNQTQIGTLAITYDGEDRQLNAKDNVTGGVESYTYDANGQRVQKSGPSGTTVYVYDALGQMAAEYSTTPNASPCTTCYLSTDHLGTVRMVIDQSGNLVSRHDYLPFGEELQAGQAGRTNDWGPVKDNIAQKFTGQERDIESGLDYFGARYYGSALGRFTSPDWSAKPTPIPFANPSDPQSLNLYAYVRNNPVTNRDLDGHWCLLGFGTTCAPPPPAAPKPPGPPKMVGVNPVTGQPGFARDPKGVPGNERPGVGGRGNYGACRGQNCSRRHEGEDVSGVSGVSDVYASTSGTIVFSGDKPGYGNTVIVDNGQGVTTLYGHDSENDVAVGDIIAQGDTIGLLGQTGNAAGQPVDEAHVHFEVKMSGTRVDPVGFLNSVVAAPITFTPYLQ